MSATPTTQCPICHRPVAVVAVGTYTQIDDHQRGKRLCSGTGLIVGRAVLDEAAK